MHLWRPNTMPSIQCHIWCQGWILVHGLSERGGMGFCIYPTPTSRQTSSAWSSFQMRWVESLPYFCTASETAQDVVERYAETMMGSEYRFAKYAMNNKDVTNLPLCGIGTGMQYFIDIYINSYISLAMVRKSCKGCMMCLWQTQWMLMIWLIKKSRKQKEYENSRKTSWGLSLRGHWVKDKATRGPKTGVPAKHCMPMHKEGKQGRSANPFH